VVGGACNGHVDHFNYSSRTRFPFTTHEAQGHRGHGQCDLQKGDGIGHFPTGGPTRRHNARDSNRDLSRKRVLNEGLERKTRHERLFDGNGPPSFE
jgi:hypothetical protein